MKALIIGPGGLRGAYSGGVVATLCGALGHGYFDRIYGCSAGAYTGSYAVSGQPDLIEAIWRECVHSNLLIDFSRIATRKRPVLDLFYLNDVLRSKKYQLSIKDMLESPSIFEIVVTNRETGDPHYFNPSSGQTFFLQVRASAAVPVLHPSVTIEESIFVDGSLSDPLPLEKALADGCDEIVIVSNRPIANIGYVASAFLNAYSSFTTHGIASKVKERLKHVKYLVETMDERVHVIAPSSNHSHRWQFDSERSTLNQLVDLGIADANSFLVGYKP